MSRSERAKLPPRKVKKFDLKSFKQIFDFFFSSVSSKKCCKVSFIIEIDGNYDFSTFWLPLALMTRSFFFFSKTKMTFESSKRLLLNQPLRADEERIETNYRRQTKIADHNTKRIQFLQMQIQLMNLLPSRFTTRHFNRARTIDFLRNRNLCSLIIVQCASRWADSQLRFSWNYRIEWKVFIE